METKIKRIQHIVPHKIMEYLNIHYEDGNLINIKEERIEKNIHFKVDIEEAETLHHLEFTDKGSLLKDEPELMFQRGRHEDFFRDQGFYEKN